MNRITIILYCNKGYTNMVSFSLIICVITEAATKWPGVLSYIQHGTDARNKERAYVLGWEGGGKLTAPDFITLLKIVLELWILYFWIFLLNIFGLWFPEGNWNCRKWNCGRGWVLYTQKVLGDVDAAAIAMVWKPC